MRASQGSNLEGERTREGLGDEQEALIGREGAPNDSSEVLVTERLIGGVGDDGRNLALAKSFEKWKEEDACAVHTWEKDEVHLSRFV